MLTHQKKLSAWVCDTFNQIKIQREEGKKNTGGVIAGVFNMWKKTDAAIPLEKLEEDIQRIRSCIQKRVIPSNFELESSEIPEDIKKSIKLLKGHKWERFYGYVKGPFLEDMFIMKKEDFHEVIEKVNKNDLKFIMI